MLMLSSQQPNDITVLDLMNRDNYILICLSQSVTFLFKPISEENIEHFNHY